MPQLSIQFFQVFRLIFQVWGKWLVTWDFMEITAFVEVCWLCLMALSQNRVFLWERLPLCDHTLVNDMVLTNLASVKIAQSFVDFRTCGSQSFHVYCQTFEESIGLRAFWYLTKVSTPRQVGFTCCDFFLCGLYSFCLCTSAHEGLRYLFLSIHLAKIDLDLFLNKSANRLTCLGRWFFKSPGAWPLYRSRGGHDRRRFFLEIRCFFATKSLFLFGCCNLGRFFLFFFDILRWE